MKIDITTILEDEPCKTIVYKAHKHMSIVFNYKTTNGIIYVYNKILSGELKPKYKLLQKIDVVHQKTGFGYKKLFKCPYCGKRRKYMYFVNSIDKFACRDCIECNVYAYRTNIYDGNIEEVIKYKIIKNLCDLDFDLDKLRTMNIRDINRDTVNMLNLLSNIPDKPKYMRWSKYEEICKQIYFLKFIYGEVLNGRVDKFKAKELNQMLDKYNVNFVYENFIAPRYFPNVYKELKALD